MTARTRFCLMVAMLVMCVGTAQGGVVVSAQPTASVPDPASVAVELSQLEAQGRFAELYRRMHPHAKLIVPEAAVVGWYEDEFAPLGPEVITVTGVDMVSWTWEVTGTTYRETAEVSYEQPFADGTVVSDVVRLVKANGQWSWFFGRTLEFVEDQIARYGTGDTSLSSSPNSASQNSPNDLVQSWLSEQFLPGELPAGWAVTSVSVAEVGQGDGPMFGVSRYDDMGAIWLNVDVTASASVLMQFAVFPTAADAERAYLSDQVLDTIGSYPFGEGYQFVDRDAAHPISVILWVDPVEYRVSSQNGIEAERVNAGTVARTGNVLIFTSVHVSSIVLSQSPSLDSSHAAVPAYELTVGAVNHVERLAGQ